MLMGIFVETVGVSFFFQCAVDLAGRCCNRHRKECPQHHNENKTLKPFELQHRQQKLHFRAPGWVRASLCRLKIGG